MKDAKTRLTETVEQLDRQAKDVRADVDGARENIERRTKEARTDVGEHLFALGEEYFPEVAHRRRRQTAVGAFGAGLAVGALASYLFGR